MTTALNDDLVALHVVREPSVGSGPWRNLIIEEDNFDALRYLRMVYAGVAESILIGLALWVLHG